MDLTQLLAFAIKHQASDLHLSAGLPPLLRVHGEIRRVNTEPLAHAELLAMLHGLMNEAQRKHYAEQLECDFAHDAPGISRFRVNALHTRRGAAAVLRAIPDQVPRLSDLQAPIILSELALRPAGLVLVTGPTGSGKSTTLAAMIRHLNENTARHVLTIEDPIEFIHAPDKSLVTQREVGTHTKSFAAALRAALREDPDVILVGELRDLETVRLALTAAETGHLVLATLHTASAARTVDRMIDLFPGDEKDVARAMLSESLLAAVSQTLCRVVDATGRITSRVAAHEVMLVTSAVRNLIREGKTAQMASVIQTGAAHGMQTLDQALAALVRSGRISTAEARSHAKSPENFPA